jgi:hypothetical protein
MKGEHAMRRELLVLVLVMGLWPMIAGAVTRGDFLAQTAQDLLHLCAASPTDPLYTEAISFCYGYWGGRVSESLASVRTLMSSEDEPCDTFYLSCSS